MLSTPEKQTRDAFTRPPSCGNDQEAKDGAKGSPLLAGIKERNSVLHSYNRTAGGVTTQAHEGAYVCV